MGKATRYCAEVSSLALQSNDCNLIWFSHSIHGMHIIVGRKSWKTFYLLPSLTRKKLSLEPLYMTGHENIYAKHKTVLGFMIILLIFLYPIWPDKTLVIGVTVFSE